MNIAVLMCSFNRKDKTIECIDRLLDLFIKDARLTIFLYDDGSIDGTVQAVRSLFDQVKIYSGTGSMYWSRSMSVIFSEAFAIGFDYYLLLNDDTMLNSDALDILIGSSRTLEDSAIVCGAIKDPTLKLTTYGGYKLKYEFGKPFNAVMLDPITNELRDVDMMNGNAVLIPSRVVAKVGVIDPVFEHGMGDIDYSLRAKQYGIRSVLTSCYVGLCSRNSIAGTYLDANISFSRRLKHLFSPKGLPPKSWWILCRRHLGWRAFEGFIGPYLSFLIRCIRGN